MNPRELEYMIAYQIGALQAMAAYAGQKVTHMKLHGALNNMAAEDIEMALAIGRAMKTIDRDMIYVALAGSQMEKAAQELGLPLAREGFCDRLYDDDGNLTSRKMPGAVLANAERDPRPRRQHGAERRDRLAHRQTAEGRARHLVPARRRALGGDRRARGAPGSRSRRRRDRHAAGNVARLRFNPAKAQINGRCRTPGLDAVGCRTGGPKSAITRTLLGMDGLGIDAKIADRGTRDRAAARLAKAGVKLPTFAELAAPCDIADSQRNALSSVDPDLAHPANLFRVHWHNDRGRAGFLRRRPIWYFRRR